MALTPTQLRAELASLTVELQARGVTTLAYCADSINYMTRGSLISCIEWARGTLTHITRV
jgi:hypothetical protein